MPLLFYGAADRTRFAFSSASAEENNCCAPSSRRAQQSTGLLHLDGFDSTVKKTRLLAGLLALPVGIEPTTSP